MSFSDKLLILNWYFNLPPFRYAAKPTSIALARINALRLYFAKQSYLFMLHYMFLIFTIFYNYTNIYIRIFHHIIQKRKPIMIMILVVLAYYTFRIINKFLHCKH